MDKTHGWVKSLDAGVYHHKPPLDKGKAKHHIME